MTITAADANSSPLLIRPVPLPRQFAVVGTIHSLCAAILAGFLALSVLKLGADAIRPGDNMPFALAWSGMAFVSAYLGVWSLHYWKLVAQRSRTTYAILPDRIEVRRDGSPTPVDVIPLDRTIAVQSWTGPYQRPNGLATLTLVVEEPQPHAPAAPPRHVFHPLPNVPDPDSVVALLQSRLAAQGVRVGA